METRDHFKNGASSKSQMSRGNESESVIHFKMKKILLMLIVIVCYGNNLNAQKKTLRDYLDPTYKTTINVIPDHAKIFIGSAEVATGTYEYTYKSGEDHVMVKFLAPGYIEKTVRVNKTDRTITHTLETDDAWAASEVSSDIANKAMRIIVKKGMESDDTWRRIIYYISESFQNMEISDRAAGWVRSAWKIENFNHETIRTRIELKEVPGQDQKTISLTLFSEHAPRTCGLNDQCFSSWDRALKTYIKFVEDFSTVLKTL